MAKRVIQVIEDVTDEVEGAICGLCWPGGWPHLSQTASCSHGEYTRQAPEAVDEPEAPPVPTVPPTAAPAADTPPDTTEPAA